MNDDALTLARVLDAAEETIRRFGPAKATVVDVARALGVSHGSVYRHVASKAALREAVAARWLERISAPLATIASGPAPAAARLRAWIDRLIALKHAKVLDDPELFATYKALFDGSDGAVAAHVETLAAQLGAIVADGVAEGVFHVADPGAAGRAILHATRGFHDPAHAGEWRRPGTDAAFEALWSLLLAGLTAPVSARVLPETA